MDKGKATVSLFTAVSALFVWSSALSVAMYTDHSSISSLTSSVTDIQQNTTGVPDLKAEVDWLVNQGGYRVVRLSTTTTEKL